MIFWTEQKMCCRFSPRPMRNHLGTFEKFNVPILNSNQFFFWYKHLFPGMYNTQEGHITPPPPVYWSSNLSIIWSFLTEYGTTHDVVDRKTPPHHGVNKCKSQRSILRWGISTSTNLNYAHPSSLGEFFFGGLEAIVRWCWCKRGWF